MEQIQLTKEQAAGLLGNPYGVLVLNDQDIRMPREMREVIETSGLYPVSAGRGDIRCIVYPLWYRANRKRRTQTARINLPLARSYAIYDFYRRWAKDEGLDIPKTSPYLNREFYRVLVKFSFYQGDYLLCLDEN